MTLDGVNHSPNPSHEAARKEQWGKVLVNVGLLVMLIALVSSIALPVLVSVKEFSAVVPTLIVVSVLSAGGLILTIAGAILRQQAKNRVLPFTNKATLCSDP